MIFKTGAMTVIFHYFPDIKNTDQKTNAGPWQPRFRGSRPSRDSSIPRRACLQLGQAPRALTLTGGRNLRPTIGCWSLTALLGSGPPRPARRRRSSRHPPGRLGTPPLGKDFHQRQAETQTSCLICYDHYESCTDCEGTGEPLQDPQALPPGQLSPLLR